MHPTTPPGATSAIQLDERSLAADAAALAPMQRLMPLLARARGRLGLRNDFASQSRRRWVLHPAEETPVPPAIYEPDDLARITGVGENDRIEDELQRLASTTASHAPTMAYELHDVIFTRGHLFSSKMVYRLDTRPFPLVGRRAKTRMREAVLSTSQYGIRYFGHWMTDDLTLTLAAQQMGEPVSALLRPTPHQSQYVSLLDCAVPVHDDVWFDKLVILDDYGQNDYKRRRYGALRDRARVALGATTPPPGVMLLRGRTGADRVLLNEAEVAGALRARGYAILEPEALSARELARACLDTPIVIGVEGSQLVHGISLMSPSGTLIELQPPARFNVLFRGRCACEGIRYACQVGHARGRGTDFTIDLPALERLLDRIEATAVPA